MEATVTIICGTILALGQAWIQYRLKQQDNSRDAAREEMAANAAAVKAEALKAAASVAQRVDKAAAETDVKLDEIHVIVNSRMSETLNRVQALEAKLGLHSGEEIPSPPTITKTTKPENLA